MTALFDPEDLAIVPIRALQEHLFGLLEKQPRNVRELAILTGYSMNAIRLRLKLLEAAGRIHVQIIRFAHGVLHVWHAGPSPYASVPTRRHRDEPRQSTVTEYPVIDRRDPAVAALFGPAKPAGSVLGGEG